MFKTYKNLSPKTRLGVGLAVIAWGFAGLHLSDRLEENFGYVPTEKDKDDLRRLTPNVIAVERSDSGNGR